MRKKLTRTGNSLALVLDRPLLRRLDIDEDTPLELSTDGEVIVISVVRNKRRDAKLREIMARADARYAGVFKKLAE